MNGGSEDRAEELRGAPDGYIRKQTIFQVVGAAVGILGAVLGLIGLHNSYRDYVDRRVDNEEAKRINADNEIRRDCCRPRR